ncbi:hypothetical protein CW693_03700 [Candidatus Bathyarchaeota archaeon]|nr:MAG: hypothetical protein CW693_03700 [Candidatus Bathyarchaeota archaeon]
MKNTAETKRIIPFSFIELSSIHRYKRGKPLNNWGEGRKGERGRMSESFSWMFVDFIPLLYERRRVARQCKVEIWLNPSPLVESLNIKKVEAKKQEKTQSMNYVV